MTVNHYNLTTEDENRLIRGLEAAISIPIIDSIEDFIWESIFCYTKRIPYVDPFSNIRSKRLYDVTDPANNIGWSAKALQWTLTPGGEFEIVIQRADVFKKAEHLGFPGLNIDSDPNLIGAALLKHWQDKVLEDAVAQNVTDKRICILLKNKACTRFAYIEEDIVLYDANELKWEWADDKKVGLKGIRKSDNFCVYKWYHNQTQFFERFKFSSTPQIYTIDLYRSDINHFLDLVHKDLEERKNLDQTLTLL